MFFCTCLELDLVLLLQLMMLSCTSVIFHDKCNWWFTHHQQLKHMVYKSEFLFAHIWNWSLFCYFGVGCYVPRLSSFIDKCSVCLTTNNISNRWCIKILFIHFLVFFFLIWCRMLYCKVVIFQSLQQLQYMVYKSQVLKYMFGISLCFVINSMQNLIL